MNEKKEANLQIISCPYPYAGYMWFDNEQRNAPQGQKFEEYVVKRIQSFFKEKGCS